MTKYAQVSKEGKKEVKTEVKEVKQNREMRK